MDAALKVILLALFALSCNLVLANEKTQDKVVLITGASRGIGLATAKCLAERGYLVYAGVRNMPPSDQFLNNNLRFEILDVTDSSSIDAAINKIIKKEGHIDVLINNAGIGLVGPVEYLTMDETKEQMDVNFYGVIRLCQAVLPHMRQQKSGHIINISSEQGTYGLPYGSLYTSSKAALESLSEALSLEVLPWNIAVSIIEPGHVSTNFSVIMGSKKIEGDPYKSVVDTIVKSLELRNENLDPQNQGQTPEDIAEFLVKVIESKNPQLRYQTSKAAKEMVSIKLKDLTGKDYMDSMKADWQETYFPKE